jgi:glutathione S-transferase
MSIVDSYAVRQVVSHGIFRPRMRQPADSNEIRRGLDAVPTVPAGLEEIAGEGQYLCGNDLSLADRR